MRSVDLANIVWALFQHEDAFYVKTTNKSGRALIFTLNGITIQLLIYYLAHHLDHPGLFLFRYINDKANTLGPERLAKRVLQIMKHMDINTDIFKAHSFRGAAASHLLQRNVP